MHFTCNGGSTMDIQHNNTHWDNIFSSIYLENIHVMGASYKQAVQSNKLALLAN